MHIYIFLKILHENVHTFFFALRCIVNRLRIESLTPELERNREAPRDSHPSHLPYTTHLCGLRLQGLAAGRRGGQTLPQVLRLLRQVLEGAVSLLAIPSTLLQLGLQRRHHLEGERDRC